MTRSLNELLLGIDAGGSKTIAWLALREPSGSPVRADLPVGVLGAGQAGPANVQAVGIDRAGEQMESAILQAFSMAGMPRGAVGAAVIGAAGAGRPEAKAAIQQWAIRAGVARRITVVTDGQLILPAGTPDGWGIALVAGTGSLAMGRPRPQGADAGQSGAGANAAGADAGGAAGAAAGGTISAATGGASLTRAGEPPLRAGGWGFLMGDEGGGYWMALQALAAVARAADGLDQPTSLTPKLMKALGAGAAAIATGDARQMISPLYAMAADRGRIARLAELTLEAATEGDEVALTIFKQAAHHLAGLALSVARRMEGPTAGPAAGRATGLATGPMSGPMSAAGDSPATTDAPQRAEPRSYPLAMSGGLLVNHEPLRLAVLEELTRHGFTPNPLTLVPHPVAGAVMLARGMG